MSHSITSKIVTTVLAVVMNGIILGGVYFLFDSRAEAAPTCAHVQSDIAHSPAVIA